MGRRQSIAKRVTRVCSLLVATLAVAIGAATATNSVVDQQQPSAAIVQWDAASGTPVPGDFRVAMYPKHAEVTLHASPDGPVVGTLNRAVLNSWQEVQAGGWIAVSAPEGQAFVQAADLIFLPPADVNIDWLGNLQSAITRGELRGYQYLSYASVQAIEGPAGSRRVTLRMSWSSSADNFVADVTPTTVSPVQWTIEQAMREFVRGMPALLLGALAFFVTIVVGVLAIARYEFRRSA